MIDGVRWSAVTVSVSSSVDASYATLSSESITATINDSRTGRQRNRYISAGLKHYCALDNASGTVYCWGSDTCSDDTFGYCDYDLQNSNVSTIGSGPIYPRISDTAPDNTTHLGDNSSSTPLVMPSVIPSNPVFMASSRNTNCVMNSTQDNVTCWGRYRMNNYGIDSGSSIWRQSHSTNSFLDIDTGREHGCVVLSDRTVKCWGYARMGAIGDGNSVYYTDHGTLATGVNNAVDIALGQDHSCALFDNGTVQCWGKDASGQLGDNATNSSGVNNGSTEGVDTAVSISGSISNFIQIAAYSRSTCGLTDNATIWCWGANDSGQLGDGTTTDRDYPVQVSGIDNARDIYLGTATGCAAVDNRTNLKCWGNYYLGDGSTTVSSTPVTVTEANGWGSDYTFDDVAIGQSSACAYNLANNQVFCWGINADGQLGLGNTLSPYSTMQNTGSPF
jgi:alpha-tubulin suppressor-like RCC1 family protein